MRIAYYNRLMNEPWGCGVHARALVRAWERAGHDVLCLPYPLSRDDVAVNSLLGRYRWRPTGIRIPLLDARARVRAGFTRSQLLNQVRGFGPNVLVVRRAAYDYGLDALVRQVRCPVVVEANAVLASELPQSNHEWLPPWETARERRLFLGAADVVAVSEAVKREVVDLGVSEEKVRVVPNGVDLEQFSPETRPAHELEPLRARCRCIVAYCGTLAKHHDMMSLVAAVRMLTAPHIGFLFIGPSEEEMSGLGIGDVMSEGRAHCTGRVYHTCIPQYLAAADICWVALSGDHGSPLKLSEYMAMAKPVVYAGGGQAMGIVQEAGCGVCVDSGDAAGLAEAVLRLSEDVGMRERLAAAGRAWISERGGWESVAEEMLRVARSSGLHEDE